MTHSIINSVPSYGEYVVYHAYSIGSTNRGISPYADFPGDKSLINHMENILKNLQEE